MSIRRFAPLALLLAAACGESSVAPVLDTGTGRGRTDIASFPDAGSDAPTDVTEAGTDLGGTDIVEDADLPQPDLDATLDADVPEGAIGPEGGRIDFDGGWIIVPPGALEDFTIISVTPEFDDIPSGFDIEGVVWRFEPNALEFDRSTEVCLTVDGIRPANMTLHWTRRGSTGIFDSIASSPVGGAVCGQTDHFSLGFLGRLTDPACDGLDCQPTPAECPTDTSVIPSVLGTCIGGTCAYPIPDEVPCDPDAACLDGACVAPPRCGDGALNDAREECDGEDFGGADCRAFGFDTGDLTCTDTCTVNSSGCAGDLCEGVVCDDPPEPICVGQIATTFSAGACTRGECAYDESAVNCRDRALACVDGECVDGPGEGELVITEIMANPAGDDVGLEWFEVLNVSDREQPLNGLVLSDDGADSLVLDTDVTIAPGAYAVLGSSAEAAPSVDLVWADSGSYALSNSSDEIELHFAGSTVDRVAWGAGAEPPWSRPNGASMSLEESLSTAEDNDSSANWCEGTEEYGVSPNLGSPGVANGPCPAEPACGDGTVDEGEDCDDGNRIDGDGCQTDCTLSECRGDLDCSTPPAPSCDGELAVTYPDFACFDGLCFYEPTATDCGAAGLGCIAGECVSAPASYGDLVITEFMANVDGDDTGFEWFELRNVTDEAIPLEGFTIRDDGTNSFDIGAGPVVAAGATFVIAETESAVPGGVDLAWDDIDSTFALANTEDEIVIEWRGSLIDRVAFTGEWPVEAAESLALSPSHLDADSNDSSANWCAGTGDYGVAPNVGTPGEANPECGAPEGCGDGIVDDGEECDDGNTEAGDGCDAFCALEPTSCSIGAECDAPPANYCDTAFSAVRFADTGECVEEACVYAEMPVSCARDTICSGGDCVEETTIVVGELVISEYLANPEGSDTGMEWFEVYNASDRTLDLNGVGVGDASGVSFTVDTSITVPAGGYFVFAESAEAVPVVGSFDWTAAESTYTLANTTDEIILSFGRAELDRIEYHGGWPDSSGVAAQLDLGSLDIVNNDTSTNWCPATASYGGENLGSPGSPNLFCR